MTTLIRWVALTALTLQLAAPLSLLAVSTTIVITEIGAYEPSDHEWIEIYNRGDVGVDLASWKFFEDNTNHGLKLARGASSVLGPGEYAMIADVADTFITEHPEVTATVFDSAWSTLSLDGEALALRDASGAFVEQFTYPPASATVSLQRTSPDADPAAASSWQPHATGNSAGRPNEFPAPADPEPPTETPDLEPVAESAPPCRTTTLQLSEFVSDPTDGDTEWIEVVNTGDRWLDLAAWTVEDGTGKQTVLGDYILESGEYFVVRRPAGALNNSGDAIALRCDGQLVDQVVYGTWDDGNAADNAPAAADPWSAVRGESGDWLVTTTPTPGAANALTAPPAPKSTTAVHRVSTSRPVNPSESSSQTVASVSNGTVGLAASITISELLPDPVGSDTTAEFIELLNTGDSSVTLGGYSLTDGSTTYTWPSDTPPLNAGDWLVVSRGVSRIALNNSGDTVQLLAPDGGVVAEVTYDDAPVGASYSRDATGVFQWSATPTPGAANVIATPNTPPEATVTIDRPRRVTVEDIISGDAGDSSDPDGDELTYAWDFGDGTTADGVFAEHQYTTAGKFAIVLTVTDGRGGSDTVKRSITVAAASAADSQSSSATKTTISAPLSSLAGLPHNQLIRSEGVVFAPPGVLGARVLLVGRPSIRLTIASDAELPDVESGDRVAFSGTMGTSGDRAVVRVKAGDSLSVIGRDESITPRPVETLADAESDELVSVSGVIQSVAGQKMTLRVGQYDTVITWPRGLTAQLPALLPDQEVTIQGIVVATAESRAVRLRTAADVFQTPPEQVQVPLPTDSTPPDRWYGLAALASLGAAGGLVIHRRRRGRGGGS